MLAHGNDFCDCTTIIVSSTVHEQNGVHGKRIISNILDEFLLYKLKNLAQHKVKIEVKDCTKTLDGVTYMDGGMVHWHIASLTQPNNDRLAEGFFEELNIPRVKNF